MTDVLSHILAIAGAANTDQAWRQATSFFAGHGFHRVNYGYTRFLSGRSVGDPDDALFLSTCDANYVNRYFRGKNFARTPLYHWSERNVGACTWAWVKQAAAEGRLTPDELASVRENQKIGISSGITISFPANSVRAKGALGLIADPGLEDADVERIWAAFGMEINAVAQMMHLKLIQFPIAGRTRPLTPRQREVLEWVADGKTSQDIAQILEVSAAMIEKHLRLAREVLAVETTAQAVAKAALLNLIFTKSANAPETQAIAAG